MNRKAVKVIAFIIVLAMIITSVSFVAFLPAAFAESKDTNSQEYLEEQLGVFENYLEFIKKYYKDNVDYNMLMDGAFEGATSVLGDPFSVYYSKAEDGENFAEAVSGEYGGIGVGLQDGTSGQHQITTVYTGGPAEKAGIQVGDIVVKIDSKDVTTMSLNDMVTMMRGAEDTKVSVTVTRSGVEKTFSMTRAIIETNCISYKMLENNIGYMKITSFDSNVADEYAKARDALIKAGAKSMIMDLRDNGGGLINGAVAIARDIVNTGTITNYERQGKNIGSEKATGTATNKLPIVALVNENSASATEILAGALQDNKAAKLVGVTTYGKGIAQQFMNLSSGDTAKVSILYFLTPNNHVINHVGITPDYVVRNGSAGDEKAKASYDTFAPMTEKVKPKAGETGLNVYAAQERLTLLGYYSGKLTATMDDATVAALKKFQKDASLFPYGVLDYTTRDKLEATAYGMAYGTPDGATDKQLEKAIELVK